MLLNISVQQNEGAAGHNEVQCVRIIVTFSTDFTILQNVFDILGLSYPLYTLYRFMVITEKGISVTLIMLLLVSNLLVEY